MLTVKFAVRLVDDIFLFSGCCQALHINPTFSNREKIFYPFLGYCCTCNVISFVFLPV